LLAFVCAAVAWSEEGEKPVARTYAAQAPAPERQTAEATQAKSLGCVSCHTATDHATMHVNPAVVLGCTDCHGGNALVTRPAASDVKDAVYRSALMDAHVLPRYPLAWKYPSSANPPDSYTLLNREPAEFIRFVNPGDYRVAREACGACHLPTVQAAERSLMSTSARSGAARRTTMGSFPSSATSWARLTRRRAKARRSSALYR
jgi:hypothetical protein